MKKILTFLFTLAVLIPSTSNSVFAAGPTAAITLSPDKKFATVSFANLKSVTKVNYTLTYQTGNRTTGMEGSIKPLARTTRTSRRQLLGTCSTRRCVYHQNPKNFKLDATFFFVTGGQTTLTKTL